MAGSSLTRVIVVAVLLWLACLAVISSPAVASVMPVTPATALTDPCPKVETTGITAACNCVQEGLCTSLAVTTTTVACSPTSFEVDASTTCTVTVTGDSPTGTVELSQDSGTGTLAFSSGGDCTLSSGTCSITATGSATGTAVVEAYYPSDFSNAASSGLSSKLTITALVVVSTTTSVSCSPASFGVGATSTCTAEVSGAASPSGTVTFSQNSGSGGVSFPSPKTCTLTTGSGSGSCAITVTGTTAGSVTIAAAYGGSTEDGASSGVSSTLTVAPLATTTSVTCSPASASVGSAISCTATVSGGSSPAGTVSFSQYSGSGSVAFVSSSTCTLSSGACSVSMTSERSGSVTMEAAYGGNTNNEGSSAVSASLTILAPTAALTSTEGIVGSNVTVSGSGFYPSSALTVSYDGSVVAMVTATSGGAVPAGTTIEVPPSQAGSNLITVTDANGNAADCFFDVTPSVVLGQTTANEGTLFLVNGTGFAGGSVVGAFINGTAASIVGSSATNSTGSFSFMILAANVTIGENLITVIDSSNNSANAQLSVSLPPPVQTVQIGVSPQSGLPGTLLTITGSGFGNETTVMLSFDGENQTATEGTCATNSTGYFSCQITVPSLAAGDYPINATDGAYAAGTIFAVPSASGSTLALGLFASAAGLARVAESGESAAGAVALVATILVLSSRIGEGPYLRRRAVKALSLKRGAFAVGVIVLVVLSAPNLSMISLPSAQAASSCSVQCFSAASSGSTVTLTLPSVNQGDLLVVMLSQAVHSAKISITDSEGDFWNTAASTIIGSGSNSFCERNECAIILYATAMYNGTDTVTVTTSKADIPAYVFAIDTGASDIDLSKATVGWGVNKVPTVDHFAPATGGLVVDLLSMDATACVPNNSGSSSTFQSIGGGSWPAFADYVSSWGGGSTTAPWSGCVPATTAAFSEVAASFLPKGDHTVYTVPSADSYTATLHISNFTSTFADGPVFNDGGYSLGGYVLGCDYWATEGICQELGWNGHSLGASFVSPVYNGLVGPSTISLSVCSADATGNSLNAALEPCSGYDASNSFAVCLEVEVGGVPITSESQTVAASYGCSLSSVYLTASSKTSGCSPACWPNWTSGDITSLLRYHHQVGITVTLTPPSGSGEALGCPSFCSDGPQFLLQGTLMSSARYETWASDESGAGPNNCGSYGSALYLDCWTIEPHPIGVAYGAIYLPVAGEYDFENPDTFYGFTMMEVDSVELDGPQSSLPSTSCTGVSGQVAAECIPVSFSETTVLTDTANLYSGTTIDQAIAMAETSSNGGTWVCPVEESELPGAGSPGSSCAMSAYANPPYACQPNETCVNPQQQNTLSWALYFVNELCGAIPVVGVVTGQVCSLATTVYQTTGSGSVTAGPAGGAFVVLQDNRGAVSEKNAASPQTLLDEGLVLAGFTTTGTYSVVMAASVSISFIEGGGGGETFPLYATCSEGQNG